LDDSFSALDADTEAQLITELRAQRRGLTTIVVSHRVSAARDADRIYVLEDGRIVETGKHEELVSRAGHYARLTRSHAPLANALELDA
jgi:ATP-binding cassette subfamily B protein